MPDILQYAEEYLNNGWSVIPLNGKLPIIKWQEYQNRYATYEEVRDWFEANNVRNIGICTGPISKLLVVDVDPRHGGSDTAERLGLQRSYANVITGSGGFHYYYNHACDGIGNSAGKHGDGIDIRATGGYVVAPPSIHPETGESYIWQYREAYSEAPAFIFRQPRQPEVRSNVSSTPNGRVLTDYVRDILPVSEGKRNNQAASLVGKLLASGVDECRAFEILKLWNSENKPPLGFGELNRIFHSIKRTRERGNH